MSSSFQSTRERNERVSQFQVRRTNSLAYGLGPGLWRHSEMPSSAPLDQYDPNYPMMGIPPGHRGYSQLVGDNSVPLSTVCPGPVSAMPEQVQTAYGYGMRRPDGSYTRLLPADEFPVTGVPRRQGPEGLIIVPATMQQAPGPNAPDRMVPIEVVQKLPPLTLVRPELSMQPPPYDSTQQRIDSIVQSSSMSTAPRRREKIYCDKWIHEGVCAFTQMGCKYKHEMPFDRATQLTLGLNHGIPNWYRRAHSNNMLPEGPPPRSTTSPESSGKRLEAPWRRLEGSSSNYRQGDQSRQARPSGNSLPAATRATDKSVLGPIAPPRPQNHVNNNPYLSLKVEEEVAEDQTEDEDEMVYKGRMH
ncbi:hypothetical protein ONS95_003177 [Cadophora gregata]|nr:uncharacterized protein ONS95_003177 [Cadophora gregata]KAK0108365.1 hypothetical protein ONS95_003177 [Cadophora gregata]KAK0109043.1 hypothetical protein ONS96_002875 [Cadophora gregata f. sp. sojae]